MSNKRHYDIQLPYHISSMWIGMVISKLQDHHEWIGLPPALKKKIIMSQQGWDGLTLTQEDLDSIPDVMWTTMAKELGVTWK